MNCAPNAAFGPAIMPAHLFKQLIAIQYSARMTSMFVGFTDLHRVTTRSARVVEFAFVEKAGDGIHAVGADVHLGFGIPDDAVVTSAVLGRLHPDRLALRTGDPLFRDGKR
jgi:hypothetical protein